MEKIDIEKGVEGEMYEPGKYALPKETETSLAVTPSAPPPLTTLLDVGGKPGQVDIEVQDKCVEEPFAKGNLEHLYTGPSNGLAEWASTLHQSTIANLSDALLTDIQNEITLPAIEAEIVNRSGKWTYIDLLNRAFKLGVPIGQLVDIYSHDVDDAQGLVNHSTRSEVSLGSKRGQSVTFFVDFHHKVHIHRVHFYTSFTHDANPPRPQELDAQISWWFNPGEDGIEKWVQSSEGHFHDRSEKRWGHGGDYITEVINKATKLPLGFARKWKIVMNNIFTYQRVNKIEFEVQ